MLAGAAIVFTLVCGGMYAVVGASAFTPHVDATANPAGDLPAGSALVYSGFDGALPVRVIHTGDCYITEQWHGGWELHTGGILYNPGNPIECGAGASPNLP